MLRTIKATFAADSSRGEGYLHDVSPGGIFVRSPLLPPDGARIAVMFETPNRRKIRVEGIVRWNTVPLAGKRVTSGFGVQIKRTDDDFECFVEGALSAVRTASK